MAERFRNAKSSQRRRNSDDFGSGGHLPNFNDGLPQAGENLVQFVRSLAGIALIWPKRDETRTNTPGKHRTQRPEKHPKNIGQTSIEVGPSLAQISGQVWSHRTCSRRHHPRGSQLPSQLDRPQNDPSRPQIDIRGGWGVGMGGMGVGCLRVGAGRGTATPNQQATLIHSKLGVRRMRSEHRSAVMIQAHRSTRKALLSSVGLAIASVGL